MKLHNNIISVPSLNHCRIQSKEWLFYTKASFIELTSLMVTGWRMDTSADNASVTPISYEVAAKGLKEWSDWFASLPAIDVPVLDTNTGEMVTHNIPNGVLSEWLGELDPNTQTYGIIDANCRFGAYIAAQYIAKVHLNKPLSGVIPHHIVELNGVYESNEWYADWNRRNFAANVLPLQGKKNLNELELFARACDLDTRKEAVIGKELGISNKRGMLQRVSALVDCATFAPNMVAMLKANPEYYSGLDKDTALQAAGRGKRVAGFVTSDTGSIVPIEESKPWMASEVYDWLPKGREYKHPDTVAYNKALANSGATPKVEKPKVDVKALVDSKNTVISALATAIQNGDTKALDAVNSQTVAINALIATINAGGHVALVQNGVIVWSNDAETVPAEAKDVPAEAETVPAEAETVPAEAETVPKDTSKKRAK